MTTAPPLLKDLLAVLAEIAAPALAESWDNVGLMVGDPALEISGVLVALDASEEVLDEAQRHGCNVVVTHHPLIFKPLQSVRTDQVTGRLLARALAGGIAVASCHTNLDKAPGGVNDALAAGLGLRDCRVLVGSSDGDPGIGFGRIGKISGGAPFSEFIGKVLTVLDLEAVRVAGAAPATLSTVAVCGGSGSELAAAAMAAGAQIYVTGEVKHSVARWAEDAGFCIVDAGHFATEKIMISGLVGAIDKLCAAKGWALDIRASGSEASPFRYYFRK
ncbi:MAG: Nif3-like dinuclear metal center hexameric protein [Desulfurivibrionaceae bacterium]|nr:Nif3-like dinuclear metal center hexameric protein [Desulfurivibrionaceae bacterium]